MDGIDKMDGWVDRLDRWVGGCICVDGYMDEWSIWHIRR